jgi:hypothetical protein
LWLAIVDLRRAWLRSGLAILAIAMTVFSVAQFARQAERGQAELLGAYEEAGAATFVAELAGVSDGDVDALAGAARALQALSSVEAPYNGIDFGLVADVSFLVFENEKQQEYLGARTSVIGADRDFDFARDYYVDWHNMNPQAARTVLGIPLFATAGNVRPPEPSEVLVASGVTDYVGVQPGAEAAVELIYSAVKPPITQRLEKVRLIGTFDMAGPDQGRFDPFWRFSQRGREVLTVRRPDAAEGVSTTLPIVLNADVVHRFLLEVRAELAARGDGSAKRPGRDQLVVRASSIDGVPVAEMEVRSLLESRGLREACEAPALPSFCLRVPERNNFLAAQREHTKASAGGSLFIALLLGLLAAGSAGLQVQTVTVHWRDFGILQALGFSSGQVLRLHVLQSTLVLAVGVAIACVAALALPGALAVSAASVATAAAVSVVAAAGAGLPVLLWPLSRPAAELLGDAA